MGATEMIEFILSHLLAAVIGMACTLLATNGGKGWKPSAGVPTDCAGGMLCTNCPDKRQCERDCIRQPEFVSPSGASASDSKTVSREGVAASPAAAPQPNAQQPIPESVYPTAPVPSDGTKTAPVDHTWFSQASLDVTAERRRQVTAEGWTPDHDDEHASGEMALAAACYAAPRGLSGDHGTPAGWPWDRSAWKPRTQRENLIRAGALILAEIERLDRAHLQGEQGSTPT